MKRTIPMMLTLLAACGNADQGRAPSAERQDRLTHYPTSYTYNAWNDQTVLPWDRGWDSVCSPTYYQAASGHAGSPNWPNGVPKRGAVALVDWLGYTRDFSGPAPVITANPGVTGGSVFDEVTCYAFSNFENLGVWPPYQSNAGPPPDYLSAYYSIKYWESAGQGPFSSSTKLWQGNSFCFLSSFEGLSHSSESAYVYKQFDLSSYGAYHWRLSVAGSGGTSGGGHCVALGRNFIIYNESNNGGIVTAWSGQTVPLGVTPGEGVCLVMGVFGNADDGHFSISPSGQWGQYQLAVSGSITAVQAMCVSYFHPYGLRRDDTAARSADLK